MATLFVEEYRNIVRDTDGNLTDIPNVSLGRTQVTTSSTTARTSFDFDSDTSFIVVYCDVECFVLLGDSTVEADSNSKILPARTFRTFGLPQGATRIAVIER